MSDTPRTDEMERILYETRPCDWIVEQTRIKHARELERELAEARKQLADWQVLQATTEQELAAERALADRLARELQSWSEIAGDYTPMDAEKALAIIGASDPEHDSHDEITYDERL